MHRWIAMSNIMATMKLDISNLRVFDCFQIIWELTCTSSWRFLEVPYWNATSGIDELIKNWTWFLNNNRISYIKARWRNSHQNIRNIARFDWTFVKLSPRMLNLQHQWSHHLLLKATQQPPRNDFRKSKRSHQPSSWNSRSWLPPSTLH